MSRLSCRSPSHANATWLVEQPKLLVPEIQFKTMSLQDESAQTQFFEALREAGVPISMKTRLHNVPIDFQEEVERSQEEQTELAVAEQESRRSLYTQLRDKGLPIPADLRADLIATTGRGLLTP